MMARSTRPKYVPRRPEVVSRNMAAVRATDNVAERALRRTLWRRGYRYRLYDRHLQGRPDVVFPRFRAVLFVDGDFWHARSLVEGGGTALRQSLKTKRREWWIEKLTRNAQRDQEVTAELGKSGWRVIRMWEQDILEDVEGAADEVERFLLESPKLRRT